MTFLTPWYSWLALAALPLILFYFLKLRRSRHFVGSLALWQLTLKDNRINAPFQKFRKHFILFFQLLALALIVLAAMQPFLTRGTQQFTRAALLIDVSASMDARDSEGIRGIDRAKTTALVRIKALAAGQKMTILAFSDEARQLTPFTDDKREIEEALQNLQTEAAPGNLDVGLTLAASIARVEPFPELTLISDGNLRSDSAPQLPFTVDYKITNQPKQNVGITRLAARCAPDSGWNILVETAVTKTQKAQTPPASLKFYQGLGVEQRLLEEHTVRPEPGKPATTQFRLAGKTAEFLHVEISPLGEDSLDSDNRASIFLPAIRPMTAWVPEKLTGIRLALTSLGGIAIFPSTATAPASFDILISDDPAHVSKDARFKIFSGLTPPPLQDLLSRTEKLDSISDWNREDSLFDHAELKDVLILDTWTAAADTPPDAWIKRGFSPLIHGAKAPIAFENNQIVPGAGRELYFLTPFERTTLPYRVAFPVILANATESVRNSLGLSAAEGFTPSTFAQMRGKPDSEVEIVFPNGQIHRGKTDSNGRPMGLDSRTTGDLVWKEGGSTRKFRVSPLSEQETTLVRAETLDLGETTAISTTSSPTGKPLWSWLVWLALGTLMVEWVCFHKPGTRRERMSQ